jgi:hypothetical protein
MRKRALFTTALIQELGQDAVGGATSASYGEIWTERMILIIVAGN